MKDSIVKSNQTYCLQTTWHSLSVVLQYSVHVPMCYFVLDRSIMLLQCYTHGPRVSPTIIYHHIVAMKPEWKLCRSCVIIGLSQQ